MTKVHLPSESDPGHDRAALANMLAFLLEAGEDMAVGESARAWFESSIRPTAMPAALPIPSGSVEVVGDIARDAAAKAPTLEALRVLMEAFEGCALRATATQLVFADGNPQARLMLVGEAPGAEEDRTGRPFVGRAGQLLDRMLAAIGLDRSQVYIANVIPWRPPGNRTPTPQETAICLPFIERQIALVNPRVLVCLGASATQSLLGIREGITRVRGRWTRHQSAHGPIETMATLHPAYLLRQPLHKRLVWRDLRAIRKALDRTAGEP